MGSTTGRNHWSPSPSTSPRQSRINPSSASLFQRPGQENDQGCSSKPSIATSASQRGGGNSPRAAQAARHPSKKMFPKCELVSGKLEDGLDIPGSTAAPTPTPAVSSRKEMQVGGRASEKKGSVDIGNNQ